MATLTKIVTGMEKGPEAIQGNFDTLNGAIGQAVTVTDWTDAGITYLNGATPNTAGLKYRTANFAGMHMLQFAGWIDFPPFKDYGADLVAVPANLIMHQRVTTLGSIRLSGYHIISTWLNGNNAHLNFSNAGGMTTGGSLEIDLTMMY